MITDTTRTAILWLLTGDQVHVELEVFGCGDEPDETAAQYIARATGLKVTIQTTRQTTVDPRGQNDL